MPIDSVGYVDYFNAPYNNKGVREVTPEQEAVLSQSSVFDYPRPKNPGLIMPPKDNTAVKTATGVIGAIGAIALAIIFRGKIKGGVTQVINAIKPYVPKSVKNVLKGGIKYVQSAYKAVKSYVPTSVKSFLKSSYKAVTKFVDNAAKVVKKYTWTPLKKLFTSSAATPAP